MPYYLVGYQPFCRNYANKNKKRGNRARFPLFGNAFGAGYLILFHH